MNIINLQNPILKSTLNDKEAEILQREDLLAFGDGFKLEDEDNVEDFVYNVMVAYKDRFRTFRVDPNTNDLILSTVHTSTGRHRSLVDLFLLCRYYFPNCSLKDVIKGLYYLQSIGILRYQTCSTVGRRVYECGIKYPNFPQSGSDSIDELGYSIKNYINIFKNL